MEHENLNLEDAANSDLGAVMHSAFTTTEICEKINGKIIVKYRRDYGSQDAQKLIDEVNALPKGTTYFVRHCA